MAKSVSSRALVWFRRDLRNFDHAALYHALKSHDQVACVFVFDTDILKDLPKADRRVEFIWDSVVELEVAIKDQGGRLVIVHGRALELIPQLARELKVEAVYTNHDYEPSANERDAAVKDALEAQGQTLHTAKDHVIFERDEVMTGAGTPFSVFTPYKNAWLRTLTEFHLKSYPVERYAAALWSPPELSGAFKNVESLEQLGFTRTNLRALKIPTGMTGGASLFDDYFDSARIDRYADWRNFPAVRGMSYLSVHLRFGTVSIRALARRAYLRWQAERSEGAALWLSELIWRDFYFQVLHHRPDVVTHCFKPEYERVAWSRDEASFKRWCDGQTGFPIVDAAMRQLNQTGYMHNRLRMIVASFLTKDLQIDYRWGERYFALHLNDFDLAANNGGWQWAASTGCDAQPYFRIFNPITQSEKFDAKGAFIRRYCPELADLSDKDIHAPWLAAPMSLQAAGVELGVNYPRPIVEHAKAREMTLTMFANAK